MNPEIENRLNSLRERPRDSQILQSLEQLLGSSDEDLDEVMSLLDRSLEHHKDRGEWEAVIGLIDLKLPRLDDEDRVELLGFKGQVLHEQLMEEDAALEAYQAVLEIRPEHTSTVEEIGRIRMYQEKWEEIAAKYLDEAEEVIDSDRSLSTKLLVWAAEVIWRNNPGDERIEEILRRSLDVEPQNARASQHLERLLHQSGRFEELADLFTLRADVGATREDRVDAFLAAADLFAGELEDLEQAAATYKKALNLDPTHPKALRRLVQTLTVQENWGALVRYYEEALRGRPKGEKELGILIQMGTLYSDKLEQPEQAEEYFRRVRKKDPSNERMIGFYRDFYRQRGEEAKILALLDSAQRKEQDQDTREALVFEMAQVAEEEVGNLEKAIDIWKGIQRMTGPGPQSTAALKRLYRKIQPPKWNALRELIKDEIESLPDDQVDEKIEHLLEVVEIYRDHLQLDVMVINTYNAILALQPDHEEAIEALTKKYEALGRWNDLIGLLLRRKESETDAARKIGTLHQVAALWIERFGNQSQAIQPLREVLSLDPTDREAQGLLCDIYQKRRNWRELMDLYLLQAPHLEGEERRSLYKEMASLAAERLGDPMAGIQVWNQVLEEEDPNDQEALAELAHLYQREERWTALAEILHRRIELTRDDRDASFELLDQLGDIYTNRIRAVDNAIEIWREVCDVRPDAPKARSILRELYVQEKRWEDLEQLFGQSGEYSELAETLSSAADRSSDDPLKINLYRRVGEIYRQELDNPERAIKAFERVMAIAPKTIEVAAILVPLYQVTERWGRQLSMYEVLIGAAEGAEELDLIKKVQALYEHELESKQHAFEWSTRAFAIDPDDSDLQADLERLAAESESWEELVQIYVDRFEQIDDPDDRAQMLRHLAYLCDEKLHRPEDAEVFYRDLIALDPSDRAALAALEQIYSSEQRWDGLVDVYRMHADLEQDLEDKLSYMFKVSFIQEERVGDPIAAIQTLKAIRDVDEGNSRALAALARLYETRGEWSPLVEVFRKQLEQEEEKAPRVELLFRLGETLQSHLDAAQEGIDAMAQALEIDPLHRATVSALEEYLGDDSPFQERVALMLQPFYERSEDWRSLVRVLTIHLGSVDDRADRIELLKRLMGLQEARLEDRDAAFESGLRILALSPEDDAVRREMARLTEQLDRADEFAALLAESASALEGAGENPVLEEVLRWELSELMDEHMGQPDDAEEHLRRVVELNTGHDRAFGMLERILRDTGQWEELRDLLGQRKDLSDSAESRRDILMQICALNENVLEEIPAAIAAYEEILTIEPDHGNALKSLERHYASEERWSDLLGHYQRQMDLAQDSDDLNQLKLLQAELLAGHLDQAETAIDLLEEAASVDPTLDSAVTMLEELMDREPFRRRVTEILEPVYDRRGDWRDLIRILLVRRELVEDRYEVIELLCRAASLHEEKLEEPQEAFEKYREALNLDPTSVRVQEAIQRLAAQLELWAEAAASWREAFDATDPDDIALRGRLMMWMAQLYDEELEDTEQALDAFEQLLAIDPSNLETARPANTALARIYEEQGRWKDLIDALRRQFDWSAEGSVRSELLCKIGQIQEDVLGEVQSSIETYQQLLDEAPGAEEPLDALERLFLHSEQWSDLVGIYHRRIELTEDGEARRTHWMRIASIHEEELQDEDQAITAYLTVLDETPDDLASLRSLSRIYRAAERWPDLLEMQERQLGLIDGGERLGLLFDLATLEHRQLAEPGLAIRRYREILELEHQHAGAREALEELLDDPDHLSRVTEILMPIYQEEDDWDSLVRSHELLAETDDPATRIHHLREIARLSEDGLDDLDRAADAFRRLISLAATDGALLGIIAEFRRVTRALEQWPEFADTLEEMVVDVLDAESKRQVHREIAVVCCEELDDLRRACEHYQQILDIDPEDAEALEALDDIYGRLERWDDLLEIINRRIELSLDGEVKRDLLVRSANICQDVLEQPADAIAAFEQVLDLFPMDEASVHALDSLYARTERWVELADLIEKKLEVMADPGEKAGQFCRLGKLRAEKLDEPARALEAYEEVLRLRPGHDEVVAALEEVLDDADLQAEAARILEPYYVSCQDWVRLINIYQIRLEAAEEPERRLGLTTRIAQLYEEQLEDLEGAFTWYSKVYLEKPTDIAIRDQILRLAGILERWQEVADVLAQFLDQTFEEDETTRSAAMILGAIYDERLYQIDPAVECFKRVLVADRADQEAFDRLESLFTRAERWEDLLDLYREGADGAEDSDQRRELLLKICRVWEEALDNIPEAIDAYRTVLDISECDREVNTALERLFVETEQWQELCDLLVRQCDFIASEEEIVEVKYRLGTIHELRLKDLHTAIDCYEEVIGRDPHNTKALSSLERLILDRDQRFRLARILEPIYVAQDEWAKLVVIYDAQLDFIDDPERRGHLLREIARLHEERGGSLELAFRALCRAFEEEFGDQDLLEDVERLAGQLGVWPEVVQLLKQGVEDVYDNDLLARIHARIATLEEERLGDQHAAVESWRKVLEAREENEAALQALIRLLEVQERYQELIDVLQRKTELTMDPEQQKSTCYRIAEIYESMLNLVPQTVETWQQVLTIDETDSTALDALDRLYSASENWMDLIGVYRQKIELAEDSEARSELYLQVARVYEDRLEDSFEAIAAYKLLQEEDPSNATVLDSLDRLYTREELNSDLLEILELKIRASGDPEDRNALVFRTARLLEREIGDFEGAISSYRQVLEADPEHEGARVALESLARDEGHREMVAKILEQHYMNTGEMKPLVELLELTLEILVDPQARHDLLVRIGRLNEEALDDLRTAFDGYSRAFVEVPDNEEVQQDLERVATSLERVPELVDVYERRLDDMYDVALSRQIHLKVARLAEDVLDDDERAERHYRDVIDNGDDGLDTLQSMDRVLLRLEKWNDLLEILEAEIQGVSEPEAQAVLFHRVGEIQLDEQGDLDAAFSAFRDALDRDPSHEESLEAMEKLLSNETYRTQVLDVLEPLCESRGAHAKLVELLEIRLATVVDPVDRTALLERISQIHEEELDSKDEALGALGRAMAEDPGSEAIVSAVERLADDLSRYEELVALAEEILGGELSADAARNLGLRTARWYGVKLNDIEKSERCLKKVLEIIPDCAEALDALERIYRSGAEDEALARILSQKADNELDPSNKRTLLVEVARLMSDSLDDPGGAVDAWRAVLDIDPGDVDALGALDPLLERSEAWEELIEVLNQQGQIVDAPAEQIALKHRVGEILMIQLEDPARAIDVYRDVLDLDTSDEASLEALEEIYTEQEDWNALQEVMMWRLEQLEGRDRIATYQRLATLCVERLDSVDEAVGYYHQILSVDPTSVGTLEQLEETLRKSERWYDLVEVLRKHAELLSNDGDTTGEVAQLVATARVWNEQLDNPEAAGEVLEEILQRDADNVNALTGLARIYETTEDWEKCKGVLERAGALDPEPREAAELEFRLGRVLEAQGGDEESVMGHYVKALEHSNEHLEAAEEVEAYARKAGDLSNVAEILEIKLEHLEPGAQRSALCELGKIYSESLDQPDRGVECLERARDLDPDDVDVLTALADGYYAADELDKAEPLLKRLIEVSGNKRRRQMAGYVNRVGAIAEKRGDMVAARESYEKAYKMDSTNGPTLVALGRIYTLQEDWQSARRIYRSMLLQNLDESVGVKKADVFYHLGQVHAALDEASKAKSMYERGLEIDSSHEELLAALEALKG